MRGANYSENAEANNGRAQFVIPRRLRRRRKHTIRMLKDAAYTADTIYQSYAGRGMGANAFGLVGGATAVIGGVATFATGGLAAPAALTAISLTSGGSSIVGGCWSIKNGYDREKEFEILHKRLRDILCEDEREIRDMLEEILHRRSVRDGSVLEPAQVAREVREAVAGDFDFANGPENSSDWINEMINRIPSVINIISHGGFPILSGVATVVCRTAVRNSIPASARLIEKEVEKKVVNKSARKATKMVATKYIASKTTKTLAKGTVVKEVSEEVASIATKKVATEEGAKTVSKQLAKNGTKAGAETAAKVARAVTMVYGGITIVWEGYNIYQNYCATQEKSPHGKELRKLAYKLERCLETGNIPF